MKKIEKAMNTIGNVKWVMTFGSKKDAKKICKWLEKQRLKSTKSDLEADRKAAKDAMAIRKGKKVIITGGKTFARYFADEFSTEKEVVEPYKTVD